MHSDPFSGSRSIEGIGNYFVGSLNCTYEGALSSSSLEGDGKLTWENGDVYIGQFHLGYRHGSGTLLSGNANLRYEGEWAMGKRHGFGTLTEGASVRYSGQWADDRRQGRGEQSWAGVAIYQGEFADDEITGEGCMRFVSGEVYRGAFLHGKPHGQGTLTWPALAQNQQLLNKYSGAWVGGLRDGAGRFSYADGSAYEGGWRGGEKHGNGKFTLRDGRVLFAVWVGGVCQTPMPPEVTENPLTHQVDISDLCPTPQGRRDLLSHLLKALPALKTAYANYQKVLVPRQPEDPFGLTLLQTWNFLRDSDVFTPALPLAAVCRAVLRGARNRAEWGGVDAYSPDRMLLFRQFLETFVRAAVARSPGDPAEAVRAALASVSQRRLVSDSVFSFWSELSPSQELLALFRGLAPCGTLTVRAVCVFLAKRGLLKGSCSEAQLEQALKIEVFKKAMARKGSILDEISITEGSLLVAMNVDAPLTAVSVVDIDWRGSFHLGQVLHAVVQLLSPTSASMIKLHPEDLTDTEHISLDEYMNSDLCFFEFIRLLHALVEVKAEQVLGLSVDTTTSTRFNDFVAHVILPSNDERVLSDETQEDGFRLRID